MQGPALASTPHLGVVTGEVGSGKTVAARAAVAALDHRHTVVYLGNPAMGVRGYFSQIVNALGGVPPFHTAAPIAEAMGCLHAEEAERGKRPRLQPLAAAGKELLAPGGDPTRRLAALAGEQIQRLAAQEPQDHLFLAAHAPAYFASRLRLAAPHAGAQP